VPDGKVRKDGKSKEGKQTHKDTQRRKETKDVVTEQERNKERKKDE
jgi:hypothetical protein